jgi:hypothetical protein
VTEAARAVGVAHTTLSAVERTIYGLTEKSAEHYAAAFGCDTRWLLFGAGASGYGAKVESALPHFLAEYDFPEWQAQQTIKERLSDEDLAGIRRTREHRKPSPPSAESIGSFDWIPQCDGHWVVEHLNDDNGILMAKPGLLWPVPAGHMKTVFKADPKSTFAFVAPHDAELFRRGDRLFVDVSDKRTGQGPEAYYLAFDHDQFVVLRGDHVGLIGRNTVVIGRVACVFGQARGR